MQSFILKDVFPSVFCHELPSGIPSEVWGCELTISKGESVLVKATSGRGKTSFCSFISGLRTDFDGEILIDGRSVKDFSPEEKLHMRRSGISFMYQDLRLFPDLNAEDNVLVKASIDKKYSPSEIRQMLCRLSLEEALRRPVSKLSLGQRQRVAFVRMLCCNADFRLLDEPVSHLDPAIAAEMSKMLEESTRRDGAGIIVTSVGYDFPYKFTRTLNL